MNDIYDEIDRVINKHNKKIEGPVFTEVKEDPVKEDKVLDTIQEQIESPMTTTYCPESIKDKELNDISKKPENYIEINFIKKIRIVDSFYIPSNIKKFTYNGMIYNIIEENIYILPTKKGYFMPTCFYKEEINDPVDFKQKNKGITGKALTLLYNVKLYMDLFSGEESKYNIFIVFLLIISISAYIIGLYFLLGGSV